MKSLRWISLGLVASVGIGVTQQDPWYREVAQLLANDAAQFRDEGLSLSQDIIWGALDDGEARRSVVKLQGQVTYVIIGECDTDCEDLDLELFQGTRKLSSDLAADDVPILIFTPQVTGVFTIRVIMASCSADPCRYGVGLFEES
ncbi:MAG: hypothetical protein AB1941_02600 [Gemmatimonadota bacterium]